MSQQSDLALLQRGDEFEAVRQMIGHLQAFRKSFDLHNTEVWGPPTDVYETLDEMVIKMAIPGLRTGSVRVVFNEDVVVVSGYRRASHDPDLTAYHQMEIRNGYFERRLVIPKPIDPEATTVDYQSGFLWIRIPKVAHTVLATLAIRFTI